MICVSVVSVKIARELLNDIQNKIHLEIGFTYSNERNGFGLRWLATVFGSC